MINIDELLARHGGLILARHNRGLKSSLSRWVRQGRLIRVMRGVYAHPKAGAEARIPAVLAAMPGAVIADESALARTFGSARPLGAIQVCTPTHRVPQRGFRFTQRTIPREHAPRGIMNPALAAVDVADRDPAWLDDLARRGKATPADYMRILDEFPSRVGNPTRRRNVARTSTNPWSMAERRTHDVFDDHKIRGWVANAPVHVGGRTYYIDMLFEGVKLAVEIDGREYHIGPQEFENDRERENALVADGWTVLHITWRMLERPDEVAALVKTVLARLRRSQSHRR